MTNQLDIEIATKTHDRAALALKVACKQYRENSASVLASVYESDMDEAFAAYEVAADDLREIRDGYRHTFPHPAAFAR